MEVLTLEAWRRRCDDILAENGKVGHTEKCNRVPGWLGRGGGGVLLRFVQFSPAVFSCLSMVGGPQASRAEKRGAEV